MSLAQAFIGNSHTLVSAPLLLLIAAHAAKADVTRSVEPEVIAGIKQTDLMRLSATRNIGGKEASMSAIARELEAVAKCCASTAWCLWNHLCVFHFICAQLGPAGTDTLKKIVANRDRPFQAYNVMPPLGWNQQCIARFNDAFIRCCPLK